MNNKVAFTRAEIAKRLKEVIEAELVNLILEGAEEDLIDYYKGFFSPLFEEAKEREEIDIEELNRTVEIDTAETNRLREEIDKWIKEGQ